ncbi:MAG TPA: hypothetical protein VJ843_03900 [Candidatus Saccharimonadales bacterium]|nr:hypothetical protein [Candidatus Saccharimonadales bacterium]
MKTGLIAVIMVILGLIFLATPSLKVVGVVCLAAAAAAVVLGRKGMM